MSSVAAVRNGSWIVLFMGTSDGQLIKLVLDENYTPGCPTVLYKSDDERAVLPRLHFDPVDFKHIYIALGKKVCAVYLIWVSLVFFIPALLLEPEILSLEPYKVSFHGKNNVLLKGRNLDSVTKIRIRGDLDCVAKESPVFDGSSDTLRFNIPPSETKGTVKLCVVTPDNLCHGNSNIIYSSQPKCTGVQPRSSWRSGGRKIHVQGTNMEYVESVNVCHSNKVVETKYNTNAEEMWIHSPRYDGSGQLSLSLNVGNSTVDCVHYISYHPDPKFTQFSTFQVADDLLVYIQKKTDELNLSMSEVNVTGQQGDREYECVLERIKSNAIIC
nr:plexin-C1-like [Danio rerio]|eukprot:XP_017210627.1 plexin-C1-like [Danio rerio]